MMAKEGSPSSREHALGVLIRSRERRCLILLRLAMRLLPRGQQDVRQGLHPHLPARPAVRYAPPTALP
eukprot:6204788-Pleurochrysis_carterae.AAC.2